MEIFIAYLKIGFEHVIPLGFDHLLFIIALFFSNIDLKNSLIQCTIFTVAHSMTLVLSAMGYVNPDMRWIEIFIALSIFLVSVFALMDLKLQWGKWVLIFVFGLVHGLGFASALSEIGLPYEAKISALIGFNIGVELAQVFIIFAVYLLITKPIQSREWNQSKFNKMIHIAIASIALWWCVGQYLS